MVIDCASLTRPFNGSSVSLDPITRGRVQLRHYTPRDSTHSPFQVFNLYLISREVVSRPTPKLSSTSSLWMPRFLLWFCGDLNFIERSSDCTSTKRAPLEVFWTFGKVLRLTFGWLTSSTPGLLVWTDSWLRPRSVLTSCLTLLLTCPITPPITPSGPPVPLSPITFLLWPRHGPAYPLLAS